jgi:membrane protein implicated in regulation of membrane protease activity
MVLSLIQALGPWTWVAVGLLILGIEIMMPSTFLLWPGLSALVVGLITLIIGNEAAIWPWQAQVLVFLILSIVIAIVGKRIMKNKDYNKSENPNLNERGAQLIGQTAILADPIANGMGRIKIGDTTWRVKGDDAKAGAKVTVVDYDAGTLIVEAA